MRISAIRETFEESGILLLSKNSGLLSDSNLPCRNELEKWRSAVRSDPACFLDICDELLAYPMLDKVYEWSNWLTPSFEKKRFDTAFFLCNLPFLPSYAKEDSSEVVSMALKQPLEYIEHLRGGTFQLAPPQVIELSRLAKLPLQADLEKYAKNRQENGSECWCPQTIFLKG